MWPSGVQGVADAKPGVNGEGGGEPTAATGETAGIGGDQANDSAIHANGIYLFIV